MRFCLIPILFTLIFISCHTQIRDNKNKNVASSSIGMEHTLQITAKLLSIDETPRKFKVLAIIHNETGVTSFSKGDTVSLYPNFIRKEGEEINLKNSENEQMASLKNLKSESSFKATIKIRGKGNKRHGLIMDWKK